jgi:hypothetical protein
MHPLGIAPVFGGGQRLQQMQQTGPQDLGKGLIERCGGIETKLGRLRCSRRRIGREIESAR